MRTFFDSSAFAKRYLEEPGSQLVDDICLTSTDLAIGVICIPEIISALNRKVREKSLLHKDYEAAKRRLSEDVHDAIIVNLTPSVISASTMILEVSPIRAMDALHVACALQWRAELFVSSDKKQISAAKNVGLHTKYV